MASDLNVSQAHSNGQPIRPQNASSCCSTTLAKVFCVALAVIVLIDGCVATGLLYSSMGYTSFSFSGAGLVLSVLLCAVTCCLKPPVQSPVNPPQKNSNNLPVKQPIKTPEESEKSAPEEFHGTMAEIRGKECENDLAGIALVNFSFIEADDTRKEAKKKVWAFLQDPSSSPMSNKEQRAMGIMLGMACGDAIGAPYEFLYFKNEGYKEAEKLNKFDLKNGQWTDDTSMGLCLADVLIHHRDLDEMQLMWAFCDWWEHGYNNAFTCGEPYHSVGLGGNINQSFDQFRGKREDTGFFATSAGTVTTSGNGSLMRLGAVAIAAKNEEEAMQLAWRQSKVTHQGEEAAGCCQLMAYLLFHALHNSEKDDKERKKDFFDSLNHFTCAVPSVNELAKSSAEVKSIVDDKNEDWNWKSSTFTFNPERLKAQPDYIGSYAMDALAMALHCVFTSDSFEEAVLKAVTRGGDADTVGAIVGQMAGALYGIQKIPKKWRDAVHQWDRGGEIATRAYLLCQPLN